MDNLQVIELNFNVKDILESQGVIGVDNLGDFRVDFLPPVQLDPNANYEICLNELIMNNPTQTGGASFNPGINKHKIGRASCLFIPKTE